MMENMGGSTAYCHADLVYLQGRVAKLWEGWECSGQRVEHCTCGFPNVQHVADDLLGVLQRFFPRHLDGGCRDRLSLHALRRAGQPICPQDREASAGLRGARAVLGDALVDGFVRLVDPVDGQRAAWGHDRDKHVAKRPPESSVASASTHPNHL